MPTKPLKQIDILSLAFNVVKHTPKEVCARSYVLIFRPSCTHNHGRMGLIDFVYGSHSTGVRVPTPNLCQASVFTKEAVAHLMNDIKGKKPFLPIPYTTARDLCMRVVSQQNASEIGYRITCKQDILDLPSGNYLILDTKYLLDSSYARMFPLTYNYEAAEPVSKQDLLKLATKPFLARSLSAVLVSDLPDTFIDQVISRTRENVISVRQHALELAKSLGYADLLSTAVRRTCPVCHRFIPATPELKEKHLKNCKIKNSQ